MRFLPCLISTGMMSAKGHVMYYTNASSSGTVPTVHCILFKWLEKLTALNMTAMLLWL